MACGGDFEVLARNAISSGADTPLSLACGDGTQAIVAAIAVDRRLPYVFVPAETRIHWRWVSALMSWERLVRSSPEPSEWLTSRKSPRRLREQRIATHRRHRPRGVRAILRAIDHALSTRAEQAAWIDYNAWGVRSAPT
jgi:hypothetical protein